ncbi:uncharacterized protein At2g24330 [Lathyrus oleraceus]|uniref:Lunapark zinc ribbon domain-containing protein n=1 Tax=Pisum sativum TaxID=3888 RepID=A0A9D4W243_PEA|nr:uncharacterized protein At2g24330-like [Pisum sativum]KAI5393941.1 hypothetical protein KIW84_060870 [Pisum sativum]
MAEEKAVTSGGGGGGGGEKKEKTTDTVDSTHENGKTKRKGLISRIWNFIFRSNRDNLEKRLQSISKEESSVMSRMNKRSRSWRRASRHIIIFSVLFEVIAVAYAIMTTRTVDMNWKMRAIRVLPMFLLPAFSSAAYSTFVSFIRMCDRRDQKTLDRLRAERKEKIDDLKEKTNYYITQQLIQKYDTDPAAKAAAATVLASKLGAESGLKLHMADESISGAPTGKTNNVELVQSGGLRNRKQGQAQSTTLGTTAPNHPDQQLVASRGTDQTQTHTQKQVVVVEHHQPQSSTKYDGGWIAQIAALLVGEDPKQSYALICGNCYMHNGLARREDFPFITYYCPHCHALNKPKHSAEPISALNSTNTRSPKTDGEADKNDSICASDRSVTNNEPVNATREIVEHTSEEVELGGNEER